MTNMCYNKNNEKKYTLQSRKHSFKLINNIFKLEEVGLGNIFFQFFSPGFALLSLQLSQYVGKV